VGRRRRRGPVLSAVGAKGEVTVEEPTASERTVARRAAEARATVPELELVAIVAAGEAPSTATLIRACALALAAHPRANAAYRDGRFELYARVNVGMVVSDEGRYLIPTVFDANRKSLAELEHETERLAAQALAGELTAPAFTGATFTLWNAAPLGISAASIPPVPPQAAALAAGAPHRGETILTLACDHRILYGVRAAGFLKEISSRLERGEV
jgi:pyruvate dehydrogenase E2 component (dihydrolipoyllysine-residue acetyltransferase)